MAKAKIFIASSYRVRNLAQKLKFTLSTDFADPVVWIEESEQIGGAQTIIEMLEKAGKTYDFAVIVLTRDDKIFTELDKEQIKARDNCIFEAGLFFGRKGRDKCYLLSSIPDGDLPADLRGIIYKSFDEPDFEDLVQCQKAIAKPADEIKTTIQKEWKRMQEEGESKKSTLSLPVVSREQMFEWETCEAGGRIEQDRPIVVNATQPYETKYKFACRVRQNIDSSNVNYYYFFQADEDGAQNISCLLQMILLAGLFEDPKQADVAQCRLNMIKSKKDQVIERLKTLRDDERLSIFFLPDAPAFEFCLHNATHPTKAKAFIKIDEDHFIEWSQGSNAHQIWRNLKNWIPDEVPPGIFHSTRLCKLSDAEKAKFKSQLDKQLKLYFPEIHEGVKKLCYEEQE